MYEAESQRVIQEAWMILSAEFMDDMASEPVAVRNHYDRRSCLTSVGKSNDEIRTCYHEHGDGICNAEDTLANKIRVLNRCIKKKFSEKGRLVKPHVERLSVGRERQFLTSYVAELQKPLRTKKPA